MKLVTFEMSMTYVVAAGESEPMNAAVDAARRAVEGLSNTLLIRSGYGIPRGGVVEVELREIGAPDDEERVLARSKARRAASVRTTLDA